MLSEKAMLLIDNYLRLPFADVDAVRCPYFVNSKAKQRGQLGVLIGKGTPQEIVNEAKIISIQYGHGIFNVKGDCCLCAGNKTEELRHYLIDHGLGIDCSGFVTHVLRQHFLQTKNRDFLKNFSTINSKNILRYLACKLRPVENIGVKNYFDKASTTKIDELNEIKVADLIIMIQTGPNHSRDHILLVTDVKKDFIEYAHARAWSNEGRYGHGVAKGKIRLNKQDGTLLDQNWEEFGQTGEKNETYLEAKNAIILEVRRIKI